MGRAEVSEFYLRSRFVGYAPDTGDVLTLVECYQDPFAGSFVVARGYEVEGPTLYERLHTTNRLTIYMLGRSRLCRPLDIIYDTVVDCLPTLCSYEGGIALDVIELRNPQLVTHGEMPITDLPLPLRRVESLRPIRG